jgi:hypothetical protein
MSSNSSPDWSEEEPTSNATNGTNGGDVEMQDENQPPRPPVHRKSTSPPAVPKKSAEEITKEAEEYKESGNKFFKAKQYEKAIAEYTKGILVGGTMALGFANTLKPLRPTHPLEPTDRTVLPLTYQQTNTSMH